jgi:hypothetical protein
MVPGRPRRRSLIHLAGAAVAGALVPAGLAEREALAAPFSADELARLAAGEVIRKPLDVDLPGGAYFGGTSYARIAAPVSAVSAVLADPRNYGAIVPMTLETRVLWQRDRDSAVYFRQGGRAGSAAYVLLVRRESLGLFRFWLDPSQPHEIADLWGYFRVQPWGSDASLLTYAALVHLDFGLVKMLFSEAIRRVALGTPALVRAYVEAHVEKGHARP